LETLSPENALVWCARITSFSLMLCSLEFLLNARVLCDEGLMSWELGRVRNPRLLTRFTWRLYNSIVGYPQILFWIGLEFILALSILLGPAHWTISAFPGLSIYFLSLLKQNRTAFGFDGADQISSYVMLAIGVSGLSPVPISRIACIVFIAFQVSLAYATAGWAKLPMLGWRDGFYLTGILKTNIYGTPQVGDVLEHYPLAAKLVTRSMLLWECTFPIAPFLPAPMAYGYLATGVLFHAGNAVLMRLNTFFWSFLGTYPALIWVIQNIPATWRMGRVHP